jgi:hypothetical protein
MDMFGFSYPLGKVLNSPGLPWVLKTSFVGVISSGVVNVNTLYNQGY